MRDLLNRNDDIENLINVINGMTKNGGSCSFAIDGKWGSGKSCEIECVAHMRFRVNNSKSIKLQPGDTFTLHAVCMSHPLYVSDIERGDMCIPAYIGAKRGGVTSISILPRRKP